MRGSFAGWALAVGLLGCATTPPRPARVATPVYLEAPATDGSVAESRVEFVTDAVCGGLVDGNHGDVSCPSSRKQALMLMRTRQLTGGADESIDALEGRGFAQRVRLVMGTGEAPWRLILLDAEHGTTLRTETFFAREDAEMLEAAQEAAARLLAP